MVTPLETQFYANVVQILGGNPLLAGLMFMGFFVALLALTKIPIQIIAPIYTLAMILVAYAIPEFTIVLVFVVGMVMASFIYSIWGR